MNEQWYDSYAAPSRPKKEHRAGKLVALALCCALLGGAMGVGGVFLGQRYLQPAQQAEKNTATLRQGEHSAVIDSVTVDSSKLLTNAQVYERNVSATVGIRTSVTTANYWGFPTTAAASGSGFILTDTGYILTNYHVIEDSTSIIVTTYGSQEYEAALLGYDESNDVAVLKIEAEGLSAVTLGNSDVLSVGDSVLAIGNPLGELTFSCTAGVVSALNREITLSSGGSMNLIQTDCAINSGNSGGALFNLYGEVIGITNAKYSSSAMTGEASIDNIGFAIPINQVRTIVESIIRNGYYAKPYIGVSVGNVSEEALSYGLPEGAAVKEVTADSPAEAAGLLANDIITAVNGEDIHSRDELVSAVSASEVGDVLELRVYRQGKTLTLTVTVGEKIQSAETQKEQAQPSQQPRQDMPNWGSGWEDFPWEEFFGSSW